MDLFYTIMDLYPSSLMRDEQWLLVDPRGDVAAYQSMKYYCNNNFPVDTTLYNCRDTFITGQVKKGILASIIAAWTGNSTAVIEHHCRDDSAFLDVVPKWLEGWSMEVGLENHANNVDCISCECAWVRSIAWLQCTCNTLCLPLSNTIFDSV